MHDLVNERLDRLDLFGAYRLDMFLPNFTDFIAFQAMPNQKFDCKELCGDLCLQFDRFGRST